MITDNVVWTPHSNAARFLARVHSSAGAASAAGVVADVVTSEAMDRLADAAVAAMGGVDVLVLNHGGPPQCTASQMTEAALVEWFQQIVVSPIRIANRLLPAMRERGWGRIIVVGSTCMQQPIPNLALSNTLRASVWARLKTMSGEVAKDGVTMNVRKHPAGTALST